MSKKVSKDTTVIKIAGKKNHRRPTTRKLDSKCSIILTVIYGSEIDFGKTFTLSQDSIRVGRDKSNTIPLDDTSVSKNHCEIITVGTDQQEQVIIKDLDSTNGTYVNGRLVRQQELNPGDKIAVGETVFRFSCNDEIEEEYHSKLFNFATTDSLTGLYNRRYILNELESQYKIAKRNFRIFSIAVMDIDNFKPINDTHGHPAGDEFLKNVAVVINRALREQDICGRIGGDEFLIVLPETDLGGACNLANRIRQRIEAAEINFRGSLIKTTISAGVSQYGVNIPNMHNVHNMQNTSSTGTSKETGRLFQLADHALYEAKNMGKNRVIKAKKS